MYKVLIVEDDPMVAMINEQYVSRNNNFSVVKTCRNGQEALDFLSGEKGEEIDLVIMDVFMPLLSGVEALKKIRGITKEQRCNGSSVVPYIAVDGIVISGR